MDDKKRKWINAANILRENVHAKIKCPECGVGYLYVKDELIPGWENKIDRFMICNHCSKYNIMTMEKPENYHSPDDNITNN